MISGGEKTENTIKTEDLCPSNLTFFSNHSTLVNSVLISVLFTSVSSEFFSENCCAKNKSIFIVQTARSHIMIR